MKFDGIDLGIGTAFFYLSGNDSYIITNWHNVTGRHPETGKILHKDLAVPNKLVLHIPIDQAKKNELPSGEYKAGWVSKEMDLYENDVPVWYEHPEHKGRVDAVAIPVGMGNCMLKAANSDELDLDNVVVRPSLDVFVLGYPRGLTGGAKFPIWKRGSIASEPEIDLDKMPKLYIDTATREGMSGAPVYAQDKGYVVPEGKSGPKDAIFGQCRRFIGIYSGRLGADDDFKAQLGIVWKEKAIVQIIQGKTLGESSL
nr:trypsin-like peptidase domain-containing protein [Aestuariibacter sp. A3R04]